MSIKAGNRGWLLTNAKLVELISDIEVIHKSADNTLSKGYVAGMLAALEAITGKRADQLIEETGQLKRIQKKL